MPTLGHGLMDSNCEKYSDGRGTDFAIYVHGDLYLEDIILDQVHDTTHRSVMDNNCVKYYPNSLSGYQVMTRTRCEQMDRQGDSYGN